MTETAAGAGVLSGIKVVDFGHFVAGPLTAVMLADQGAEVVHVDRPGAELAEADAFLNRGKRRVTLDLKDPADAAIAARLAASADVVIENFRPGVMDRHGLGWQQLAPVAPPDSIRRTPLPWRRRSVPRSRGGPRRKPPTPFRRPASAHTRC
jgi:crotonobetainyl-CoA:carnitine CoA-transferase CaiB-like acyl-CoA transferase